MSQLVIELSEPLDQQLAESGMSQKQLQTVVSRFLQLYLYREQMVDVKSEVEHLLTPDDDLLNRPRFGSGKHLNITMSEDFDEPLVDFAEYMQ
jgi:hypothetical protein